MKKLLKTKTLRVSNHALIGKIQSFIHTQKKGKRKLLAKKWWQRGIYTLALFLGIKPKRSQNARKIKKGNPLIRSRFECFTKQKRHKKMNMNINANWEKICPRKLKNLQEKAFKNSRLEASTLWCRVNWDPKC